MLESMLAAREQETTGLHCTELLPAGGITLLQGVRDLAGETMA